MSATQFRDHITVTRSDAGGGVQDPDTGAWVAVGGTDTVLDCPANVQAGSLLRAGLRQTGTAFAEADGVAFVPPAFAGYLMDVRPQDAVEIKYAPRRRGSAIVKLGADAEAMFVRPEDRAIVLRYR